MYRKGRKRDTLEFSLKVNDGAQSVAVAGEFSQWKPVAMARLKNGSFHSTVGVRGGGNYEYKFLVDGQWVPDPDNNVWAMNRFGTLNSVAHID